MCLIVDANVAAMTFTPNPAPDFQPVWDALWKCRATTVFGGQLAQEYYELRRHRRIIREMERSGRLCRVADAKVRDATNRLIRSEACVSDDEHIVALAKVSGVRLLCSHDRDLHTDFTNPRLLRPPGHVYQNPAHAHLIRKFCDGSATSRRKARRSRKR